MLATDFVLTGNGSTELLVRYMKKHTSVGVLEANFVLTIPLAAATHNFPVVSSVAISALPECRNFLLMCDGTLEEMTVQVSFCCKMLQTDCVTTLDDLASVAVPFMFPSYNPIAVVVVRCTRPGDRLLSATGPVLDIMGVEAGTLPLIEKFEDGATCDILEFTLCPTQREQMQQHCNQQHIYRLHLNISDYM